MSHMTTVSMTPVTAATAFMRAPLSDDVSAVLQSARIVLAEVDRTLSADRDRARRLLASATALLRAAVPADVEIGIHPRGPANSGPLNQLAPWQINRVNIFIAENLETKIGLKDLARLTRLSVSHFARAFRCSTGCAPHAYLLRCRIARAKELLLDSSTTLACIALRSGFADQAHLTKVFGRLVGVSPGVWRRHHHAGLPIT
jgi:AraC family transcriptional regulator